MKSATLALLFAAVASTSAGGADRKEPGPSTPAVLLDHAEYMCDNCLFGNADYYFCFDVNSKILIGHEKIRTQMRKKAPQDLLANRGQTVPIHFNDKYIWIPGPKGTKAKDQRLTQDYTKKLFSFSAACQKAVQ